MYGIPKFGLCFHTESVFAVMACVALVAFVAILVGCDKKEGKSEVAMSVYELTDSTAMLKCDYNPAKSVSYDLLIGETVTKKYATLHLLPRRIYRRTN